MKYIIAGSHRDALNTAYDLELTHEEFKYIHSPEQLYGLHNVKIIFGRNAFLSPAYDLANRIYEGY